VSGSTGSVARHDEDTPYERVLAAVKDEIVALFGFSFPAEAIRVDVDVFESGEPLVDDRPLDSMDLVQTVAVLEDRFDVSLAPLLTGDDPLTLASVARHIAEATS